MECNNAIQQTLKEQKILIDKLNDQESRLRRNNLQQCDVPDGAEGSSVPQFVEKLALTQKPNPSSPPRSIVVNFLQYNVKETVLKNAWQN